MFYLDLSSVTPTSNILHTLFNGVIYTNSSANPYITIVEPTKYKPKVLKPVKVLNTCRESFTYTLGSYYHDKNTNTNTRYGVSPLIKNIKIILIPRVKPGLLEKKKRGAVIYNGFRINQPGFEEFKKNSDYSDKIAIVENMIHIFEDEIGFKRSKIAPCSWLGVNKTIINKFIAQKDDDTVAAFMDILNILPIYVFDMDKRFLATPHSASLYTLLVRTIFTMQDYEIFKNITDINSLKDAFEKYKKTKSSGDPIFFADYELWFEYCKNMKSIYDSFNPTNNFHFPNFSNDGITNLCKGKISLAPKVYERFQVIKDKMNNKSIK